ncbi:MAG: hypothetical protein HY078_02085 [Elusimicrobia bacterium]|nr:hypothetical protein [Elusimicrobiota bacterium]
MNRNLFAIAVLSAAVSASAWAKPDEKVDLPGPIAPITAPIVTAEEKVDAEKVEIPGVPRTQFALNDGICKYEPPERKADCIRRTQTAAAAGRVQTASVDREAQCIASGKVSCPILSNAPALDSVHVAANACMDPASPDIACRCRGQAPGCHLSIREPNGAQRIQVADISERIGGSTLFAPITR